MRKSGEKEEKASVAKTLVRLGYIVFNMLYVSAFVAYSAISIYSKNQTVKWVPYVIIVMSVIYFVTFVVTLLAGNKKEVKANVKNYKSSLKIFKKILKLSNLALSVMMITNTVLYDKDSLFSFVLAAVSLPFVVLQIITEIVKIVKRRKKLRLQQEKESLKNDYVSDVKEIATATFNTTNEEEVKREKIVRNGKINTEEVKNRIKEADQKINAVAGGVEKLQQRTKQYGDDKKNVGKKKK